MTVEEKRKEMLHMDDRAMIDRILAFPNRQKLNRDENDNRRRYPSAEMAVRAYRSMGRDRDWQLSAKQKYVMADSFARYSMDNVKVAGIKFAKADPNQLVKDEVSKEGVKSVYFMTFHLAPEPENEYDKNAVAVYVDNVEGLRTRIGYLPSSYTGEHPIVSEKEVKGTLTDHSNGHFKTISYSMDLDTEAIDQEASANRSPEKFTYQMPFFLNGAIQTPEGKMDPAFYLSHVYTWRNCINAELEDWGVNGKIDEVSFEFPAPCRGNIVVETSEKLNSEAMQTCSKYLYYALDGRVAHELKKEGYVQTSRDASAVNTREKTYLSLQAEPAEDFVKAVTDMKDEGQSL